MPTARTSLLAAACLAAAMLASGTSSPPPEPRDFEEPAEEEGPYPSDWFGAQRAFPGTTVNQEAYLAALEWARVERAATLLTTQSATPMFWTEAGPFDIGGRVTALAVAPGGGIVYLGAAAGGVHRSNDGGATWSPVFEHVASIGALAMHPSDPNVVYVGTGEANAAIDNYDGAGLFRTSDGGASWSYLGLEEVRRIARVRIDPADPSRIFVAAMGSQFTTNPHRGLYRSENGGASWTKVLFVNDSTGVGDVAIHPTSPETVYCATWERIRRTTYRRTFGPGCAIWRSADHGETWTKLTAGLPAPADSVGRIGLAIAPSSPTRIYAQIIGGPAQGLDGLGLYRSDDGGSTWSRKDVTGFVGAFGGFGWYFGDVAVSPSDPNRVYCLGQALIVSYDGGVSFGAITSNSHPDFHAMWIDPANQDHLYVGTDGGFFSTTDAVSFNWVKSVDLPITQFYAGAIDPANPSRILGGSQDNSTPIWATSAQDWTQYYNVGDGFYCLIDPTNSSIGFAEFQNMSNGNGPRRTTNNGASWGSPTGFVSSDRYNWCAPFTMSPSNHNLLLAGSHRVYRSTNNGTSYAAISPDLTRNLPTQLAYASSISTLDISPVDGNHYYAGTADGRVWRTTNSGSAWTEITGSLPVRWVTRVTCDRFSSSVVYVTLSGFSQDEPVAHVYRSADMGATWTAIDGNLPDVPANDILVDSVDPNRLYLATDVGVFTTRDLGGTWYPLGLGMPPVPVADLTLHAASRTLVAATHGRSQWKLDLNDLAVAVGDARPPARLELSAPRPNPSRRDVLLELALDAGGRVRAEVFDPLGRRIARLLDRTMEAGRHPLLWNGRLESGARARAGVYLVRVSVDGRASATRRVTRLD